MIKDFYSTDYANVARPVNRCQAMKSNARPCHRIDTKRVKVFADKTTQSETRADWVRVWLCREHQGVQE